MPSRPRATPVARLTIDGQTARRIAAIVAETFDGDDVAAALSEAGGGLWDVAVYFENPPDREALRRLIASAAGADAAKALRFEQVEAADWAHASLAGLPPVVAGRFVVHGGHDRALVPRNRIGIEIEAALAFGTGHHGTTRGCLLALDALCKTAPRGLRILDLGTGSGVLAIAAARAFHRRVLATDIDVTAVRVARANAQLNRAGAMVEVVSGDGVAAQALRRRAPFDLIFANILLGPLLRLAAPLRALTARGGRIVLSGIVPAQANAVIAAYRPLALERRTDLDGWTTLVLARRAQPQAETVPRRRT